MRPSRFCTPSGFPFQTARQLLIFNNSLIDLDLWEEYLRPCAHPVFFRTRPTNARPHSYFKEAL
jgi:hypothetical protein